MHDQQVNRLRLFDRLADDLAHEVKNPLNAIVINLELLKRRLLDGETDNALYRAECVTEEIRRVSALTDALFHALRTETDPDTPTDVDGTVRGLLPVFALQAKLAGAELLEDLAVCPARARMAEPVLKHLLLNLVTGALDALEPGGAGIRIGTEREGDRILIRVGCTALRRRLDEDERWTVVQALAVGSGARFLIENTDLVLSLDRVDETNANTRDPVPDHASDRLHENKRTLAETETNR